jgi:hypothetical protein
MCGSGKEKVGQTGRRRRKERSEILGLFNSSHTGVCPMISCVGQERRRWGRLGGGEGRRGVKFWGY